jgi:hypothetical protein
MKNPAARVLFLVSLVSLSCMLSSCSGDPIKTTQISEDQRISQVQGNDRIPPGQKSGVADQMKQMQASHLKK